MLIFRDASLRWLCKGVVARRKIYLKQKKSWINFEAGPNRCHQAIHEENASEERPPLFILEAVPRPQGSSSAPARRTARAPSHKWCGKNYLLGNGGITNGDIQLVPFLRIFPRLAFACVHVDFATKASLLAFIEISSNSAPPPLCHSRIHHSNTFAPCSQDQA